MKILRASWFLATIVVWSHADILNDVATSIFGEEFTEVENKVVETAQRAKTWYNNHQELFNALETGAEIALLAGTGLGEAGMLAEIGELYDSGAFKAILDGARSTYNIIPEDMATLKSTINGMFTALKSLKSLASTDTVFNIAEATIDTITPWLEKFASGKILEKYPATATQLVILFGNLIGTSGPHINTPEVACKMDNILTEYRKRMVNARLEQLQEPKDFRDAVTFFKKKIKMQNKEYNKDGYTPNNEVRCDIENDPKCFTDKFRREKNKQICSSWDICYEDYVGWARYKTEAAFPTEAFKNVCHGEYLDDQTDGNFVILHRLKKFITKKIY